MLRTVRLVVISILLSLTALSACTPRRVGEAMNRADSLMTSAPDSALALLDAIDPATLRTDAARAHHALLLSQALDKNYVDVTDDSLISIADDYYARTSDTRSQMLSLFYHGRVAYNAKDYPRALVLFTRSLDLARSLDDPFWSARNAGEISLLYQKTYRNAEELKYAVMAHEYYNKTNNQDFMDYSLLSIARANLNAGNDGDALQYAEMALKTELVKGDRALEIEAQVIRGKANSYLGNIQEAIDIFEGIIDDADANQYPIIVSNLGMAYLKANRMRDADSIYHSVSVCADTATIMTLGYNIARKSKDYENAFSILNQLHFYSDSILGNALNQSLNSAIIDRFDYEERLSMERARNTLYVSISILVFIVFLLIIAIRRFHQAYRRQQRQIEHNMEIAQNLEEILSVRDREQSSARKTIKNLMSSRFSEIDRLCKMYYENQSTKGLKKKTSDLVESFINDMSADSDNLRRFQEIANSNYGGIISKFHKLYPDLKQVDYLLYLYSTLGFSIPAIALFLKEDNIGTIYNRKARLKRRLKTLPENIAEEMLWPLE